MQNRAPEGIDENYGIEIERSFVVNKGEENDGSPSFSSPFF